MLRRLLAASILVLVAGPARAGEPPAAPAPGADETTKVVTLREAAQKGLVEAQGFRPSSYRRVFLRMKNKTDDEIDVDVCASYLKPKRGRCQRLGLGPPVTPRPKTKKKYGGGRIVVSLEAGEETELELNTCCLDAGLPAPSDHEFVVAERSLPPEREKVLRWWADNPTAPQHAVNTAIWQFRDEVYVTPGVVPTYREPVGRFAAAHGGTYYRLVDGELFSIDADGIRRFLGTEIFQVIPVEGAVYAVALGEDRKPDLWRLALTGIEPWGFVMDLDVTDRVVDVIPGSGGSLVLVTDQGIRFWNRSEGTLSTSLTTEQILHLSTRLAREGRLQATVQRPPKEADYRGGERYGEKAPVYELWSVDLASGAAERVKEFWNVRAMLAGPAGVFGISHKGRLRELARGSFHDVGTRDTYDRILAVGTKVLWLVGADGKLVAAGAKSGRVRFKTELEASDLRAFDLDEATDDLVYVLDLRWYRLRAADGTVEEITAEDR